VNGNAMKRKLLFVASLIDLWLFYSVVLRLKELTGKVVICDRYIWDTYIDFKLKYPEYKFENGFWWNLTLKTMLKPKQSFCLFIPAEESMRRSELKEEPFPEEIVIRKERIKRYLEELENNRWDYVIDATKPIREVYQQIVEYIEGRDNENFTNAR
jgi:thymidylate kinase